ncbi:hypothetical protein TKK_0000560 [Trichogramma kaykai]|uniref:CCHC-type domain-containing protein n=1 Tax=Trichogramma kaykai TaxID=54128 RepID=A0ABD2WKR4_9HYME
MPTASEIQSLERAARKVIRGSDEWRSLVDRIVALEDEQVLMELAKSGANTLGSVKEARDRLLRLWLRLQGYESASWTPEVDGDVTFCVVPRDSEQLSDPAGAGAATTSTNTATSSTVTTSFANTLTSSGSATNTSAMNLGAAPVMSTWANAELNEPMRLALQARGWTPPPTPIDPSRRQRKSRPKESTIVEETGGESPRRSSASGSTSRASTPVRGSGRSKLAAQMQQLSEQLARLSASSLDEKPRKRSSPRADPCERKRKNMSRKSRDSSSEEEEEKRVASKPQRKAKHRTKPPRESSASSSEASEAEQKANRARANRTRAGRTMDGLTRREKFMRLLASYKLNFKSGDKTKAQLFLERAKEFRNSVPMTLTEFFDVMSFAFSSADNSDLWYRTHKRRFATFADFETAFKNMYIGPCDEDDIIDELQHRVQGKNEPISEYLTFVRHLVMQLDDAMTEKKLARMVWRNLRPAYRLVLNDECPNSIDEIESRGLRYERGRALDAKIDKSVKDRAAHAETKSAKVGALAVESTKTNASPSNASSKKNSNGGKKNANDKPNVNANANANAGASAKTSANNTSSANAAAPATQQTTSSQPTGADSGFIGACYGCGQTGHRASRCPRTKCYRCHGFGHRARECSMSPPAASPSAEKCQFCGMENATFLTCPRCTALRQMLGNAHAEAQSSQAPPQSQFQQR